MSSATAVGARTCVAGVPGGIAARSPPVFTAVPRPTQMLGGGTFFESTSVFTAVPTTTQLLDVFGCSNGTPPVFTAGSTTTQMLGGVAIPSAPF